MIAKQSHVPLSEELQNLKQDAFRAAQNEWDGWSAEPLTDSQVFQINFIVKVLLEKALHELNRGLRNSL